MTFLTHCCVIELENTVNISTSNSHTAGQPYSLTCTVTSDRPPQIKWLDPNRKPVSGEGITVSPQVTNGLVSTVEITFSSLRTSHSGIYTCISTVTDPPLRKQAVHQLRVESKKFYFHNTVFLDFIIIILLSVPPPRLLITREPAFSVRPFTTGSLILTCIIQLVPEVDTPVTVNSQWTGHSSLTNNQGRVIISELEGIHPMYESSVTFSTLKSSDSGSYICSANVSPLSDTCGRVVESSLISQSLQISVGKYMNIATL